MPFLQWREYLTDTPEFVLDRRLAKCFKTEEDARRFIEKLRKDAENLLTTLVMVGRDGEAGYVYMFNDVRPERHKKLGQNLERAFLREPVKYPYEKRRIVDELRRRELY
jgi:hypothetical protein